MNVSDFDFDLPAELIAQQPPAVRGGSRLLALDRASGRVSHHRFSDLPSLLVPGDVLVVNDTRVFPARLIGRRLPGGGAAECLLVRRTEVGGAPHDETWIALVHPGQRLREGSRMVFESGDRRLHAEVLGMHFHGRRTVRLWTEDGTTVREAVDALGHVPLPPYIKRDDVAADRERYQTIYARERGSIAAPTAGLHFTPALFEALETKGIITLAVTLHVGYGTFQPLRVDRVEEHEMEAEDFEVSAPTAAALTAAKREGRRIIAVGTTSVRTLESLPADPAGNVQPGSGETALFIHPGHRFRLVSGMVTNFHLPRSSLLMLVAALAGTDRVLAAYREAVAKEYRFYSYGDAMLIL
ncbi:MAG: tRNA preQ1(34) S-adenosylmethionine ribosyltransferase-isomerase QueA [Acidobacteria bacterium RIFCSPLOWO2_12_FULL_67_14b]|nr:MAG: tRNA preQ1(34) S-adenosylmethionine ribosyltransferase-isomerase QueA [Acidobacteria bacterium RIFCSPLOWO2_12_FULL_67_14b]